MAKAPAVVLVALLVACAPNPVQDGRSGGEYPDLVWPTPPQAARIRYLYSFSEPGQLGIRPGIVRRVLQLIAGQDVQRMLRPYAVAADDELIAVSDPGRKLVHLFMPGESRYDIITDAGGEPFRSPVGLCLGQDTIYVADSAAGKVFIFNRDGEHSGTITDLRRPTGMAFHAPSGRLYVTDTLQNEIVYFDRTGTRLGSFGVRGLDDGQFNYPTFLAIAGDSVLVNDTLNYRVQAFTLEGEALSSFGKAGDGSGQFALSKGLAVDSQGHVYVADALSNYVQIFDEQGRFLLSFGGMGTDFGRFMLPAGVHVSGDTIFIADSQNGRVQVFEYLGSEL